MNLTEDEAKQRWCPFANVNFAGRLPGNANRIQKTGQDSSGQNATLGETIIPAGAKCLGSACMAWRWEIEPMRGLDLAVTRYNENGDKIEPPPPVGRCGLAK